jgi:LAO/AO transport system kinase
MEIDDFFVVNKADRPGADKLRHEIEVTLGIRRGNAFRHFPAHHGFRGAVAAAPEPQASRPTPWEQPVLLIVAAEGEGVPELIAALDRHHDWLAASGTLDTRRRRRLLDRTREVVDRATRRWVWEETHADRRIAERLDDIVAGQASPYDVAAEVLDGLKQSERI